MSVWRVEVTRRAAKDLASLPRPMVRRIEAAIAKLSQDPHPSGSLKLQGEDNRWRIRVGVYRVVYDIHDQRLVIVIVRVGHRGDIYR